MRYVALAFGLAVGIFLFSLETVRVMGMECRILDRSTLGEPVCIRNGVFAAAFAFAGVLVFFGAAQIVIVDMVGRLNVPAAPAAVEAATGTSQVAHEKVAKWRTLVELDADIAAVAAQVRSYGARYEAMLADRYLTVADKAYLQRARDLVIQMAIDDQSRLSRDGASSAKTDDFARNVRSETLVQGVTVFEMKDGKVLTNIVDVDGGRMGFATKEAAVRYIKWAQSDGGGVRLLA